MSMGCGFSSSNNYSQFTPNPVPTAATTSTVTITTSPATMNTKQWEQHHKLWKPAPQGWRHDLLENGPATMLPDTLPVVMSNGKISNIDKRQRFKRYLTLPSKI